MIHRREKAHGGPPCTHKLSTNMPEPVYTDLFIHCRLPGARGIKPRYSDLLIGLKRRKTDANTLNENVAHEYVSQQLKYKNVHWRPTPSVLICQLWRIQMEQFVLSSSISFLDVGSLARCWQVSTTWSRVRPMPDYLLDLSKHKAPELCISLLSTSSRFKGVKRVLLPRAGTNCPNILSTVLHSSQVTDIFNVSFGCVTGMNPGILKMLRTTTLWARADPAWVSKLTSLEYLDMHDGGGDPWLSDFASPIQWLSKLQPPYYRAVELPPNLRRLVIHPWVSSAQGGKFLFGPEVSPLQQLSCGIRTFTSLPRSASSELQLLRVYGELSEGKIPTHVLPSLTHAELTLMHDTPDALPTEEIANFLRQAESARFTIQTVARTVSFNIGLFFSKLDRSTRSLYFEMNGGNFKDSPKLSKFEESQVARCAVEYLTVYSHVVPPEVYILRKLKRVTLGNATKIRLCFASDLDELYVTNPDCKFDTEPPRSRIQVLKVAGGLSASDRATILDGGFVGEVWERFV